MGSQADTKARGRALNGTRSGSAEKAKLVLAMERKTWEDIEHVADHVCDFGGVIYSGQVTAGGTLTITLGAPIEYSHDALDATIAGKGGALYFRAYVVTPESLMRAEEAALSDGE